MHHFSSMHLTHLAIAHVLVLRYALRFNVQVSQPIQLQLFAQWQSCQFQVRKCTKKVLKFTGLFGIGSVCLPDNTVLILTTSAIANIYIHKYDS